MQCQGWVPVVSGERTFLHHSRDFSGPTTVRRVSTSPANVQNPPHCLLPWGLQGQEGGGKALEALSHDPSTAGCIHLLLAQGQRPFTSLDSESSSTEALNMLVLCRDQVPLSPTPTPAADSCSSFSTQTGLISPVLGGRWVDHFSLGGEAQPAARVPALPLLPLT